MKNILVSRIPCSCGEEGHYVEAIARPEAAPGQPNARPHLEFEVAVVTHDDERRTRRSISLDRAGMEYFYNEIGLLLAGVVTERVA